MRGFRKRIPVATGAILLLAFGFYLGTGKHLLRPKSALLRGARSGVASGPPSCSLPRGAEDRREPGPAAELLRSPSVAIARPGVAGRPSQPKHLAPARSATAETIQPAPLEKIALPPRPARRTELAPHPRRKDSSGRDLAAVRAVMLYGTKLLQHAYQRELRLNPDFAGSLTVRIVVEPFGRVSKVEILDGELAESDFAKKAASILAELIFPASPESEAPEAYRQTFVFRPAG